MKKRIELNDNEVGLGSWLYTTWLMINDDMFDEIWEAKHKYQKEHGRENWRNACLFCQQNYKPEEYTQCEECPLTKAQKKAGLIVDDQDGCDEGSWYDKICFASSTHEERIKASINICRVMAEELKEVREHETTNQTENTVL